MAVALWGSLEITTWGKRACSGEWAGWIWLKLRLVFERTAAQFPVLPVFGEGSPDWHEFQFDHLTLIRVGGL